MQASALVKASQAVLDSSTGPPRSAHSTAMRQSRAKTPPDAAVIHDHRPRRRSMRMLAHGIDTIYALPGVQNDHLFDALFKRQRPHARPSTPATSRARPTWRSAPRSRPASRGLCRGAGAGPAQLRGRAAHRLFDERAGAGADRPNPRSRHRPRISAICTRSATRPASSRAWSIIRRRIRKPAAGAAAGRRGDAARWHRAGPARPRCECAMDVWGKSGR